MSDNQPSTPAPVERTATGEIADQGQTSQGTTTPQTTTTSTTASPEDKSLVNQETKSLANQVATGAPEAYEAFNVPEGFTLDEDVSKEAGALFKGMNLPQADAQKLVDFYVGKTQEAINAPYELWRQTQERWVREVRSDPTIGPRMAEVTQTISRAIDGLGDPKLAQDFREAMDYTGAGNNPAFIRAFYRLAQKVTEGGHVAGRGPSPAGQSQRPTPLSAANAMYPNLP